MVFAEICCPRCSLCESYNIRNEIAVEMQMKQSSADTSNFSFFYLKYFRQSVNKVP